jgi:hypothetical protein
LFQILYVRLGTRNLRIFGVLRTKQVDTHHKQYGRRAHAEMHYPFIVVRLRQGVEPEQD